MNRGQIRVNEAVRRVLSVVLVVAWSLLVGSCQKSAAPNAVSSSTASAISPANVIRLATYNVRNYNSINRRVDGEYKPNWPKPESEKTPLRAVIRDAHPDILAIQEMGGEAQLAELRHDLAAEGLTYSYSAWVNGPDPDRHVALLSKVPLTQVHKRENIPFKLNGYPESVKRGLLEVDFVTNGQHWALYVVHLKSRLTEIADDPQSATEREAEARAVRDIVRQEQPLDQGALVAVVGDFNDARDSPTLKRFLEVDNKPLLQIAPSADSHGETWTSTYGRADQYDRSDYILLSPAMVPLQKGPGGIDDIPASLDGSDHRLVWVDLDFPPVGAKP